MKRSIATSTAAVRERASDLSAIVATLVVGSDVEQLDAAGGWVKIRTETGREGWLHDEELSELAEAAPPTLAAERAGLASELEAVEQKPLETFVSQIEQVVQAKQTEANREPTGWQFDPEKVAAKVLQNYTYHALGALFLYTFMWIPGLIANIAFLKKANQDEQRTGKPPQGKGCLVWLLWVFGILPVVIFGLLLAIGILVAE